MNHFNQFAQATIIISPVTKESVAGAFGTTGWTTANWPTANKSVLCPFVIQQPITVKMLGIFNGNPVSGNWQVGIYDQGRALRISTPITAQAGINIPQAVRVPDTELLPGSYWLAGAMDNNTGNVFRRAAGLGDQAVAYGYCQVSNNFPLKNSIAGLISRLSTATIPMVFLLTRDFI